MKTLLCYFEELPEQQTKLSIALKMQKKFGPGYINNLLFLFPRHKSLIQSQFTCDMCLIHVDSWYGYCVRDT